MRRAERRCRFRPCHPARSAHRFDGSRPGWGLALVVALLAVLMCGCGAGSSNHSASGASTTRTTSTNTGHGRHHPSSDELYPRDTGPSGLVMLGVGSGAPVKVVRARAMVDGSVVSSSGSAIADMTFAGKSTCWLQAVGKADGQAISREPPTALLELQQGTLTCTVFGVTALLHLCGDGSVLANGTVLTQFAATCQGDPVFEVAVRHGAVRVRDPSGGSHQLSAGVQLSCNPDNCVPKIGRTSFSPPELRIFNTQGAGLTSTASTMTQSPASTTATTAATTTTVGLTSTATTTTTPATTTPATTTTTGATTTNAPNTSTAIQ